MKNPYEDIINLTHPTSRTHMRMSMTERGAQFAPFAALTGYDDEVKEKARLTQREIKLEEGEKQELDRKLRYIYENINSKLNVEVTYFVPDKRKAGGSYQKAVGRVSKVDIFKRIIRIGDDVVPIDRIYAIDTAIFY